jgi:hypothetical protein
MAVVSSRSDQALRVPPYESSGPSEVFDRLIWSCGTQLGTGYFYPYPSAIMSRLEWTSPCKGVLPYKPTLS